VPCAEQRIAGLDHHGKSFCILKKNGRLGCLIASDSEKELRPKA
jgi:hypothetical protein